MAGATTSAPSTTPGPSYDVVHLSARNARLEEKLSKALAKNRSMAKYYDQLLAKTRDAQEREMETLTAENRRLVAEAARGGASAEELDRARAERDSTRRELEDARARLDARDGQRGEESAATAAALRVATDQLAARDEEVATLRAALRDARAASPLAESTGAVLNVSHGGNTQTLSQMQRMLDQAREERERERKQAAARDKEMARQLNDIKEQALDRIKETTAAAKEVAALKERARAAEAERDRLRDVRDELEADDHERRELRRRFAEARDDARVAKEKAERCDLAEAKLRASEANVATLQEERAEAHRRLQEMTERLLSMSNEKDVLVRHSAHQVHVEAELAVARREVERLGRTTLAARAKASESGAEWREGAESLGRVLRAHIYGHARWEREVAEETNAASEAHAHGQRSAVRLVAAAERDAAALAGEAIEVIRTTRQLLREYGAEAKAVMEEVARAHERRADERVEAALSMLREAERRATTAERDAAENAADARRARTAAARAGALPSSLVGPMSRPEGSEGTEGTVEGMAGTAGTVDGSSLASDGRRAFLAAKFQLFGVAMWRRATRAEEASDAALLRSQLALARRETEAAEAEAERSARRGRAVGVALKWGVLAAGALRRRDRSARNAVDDVAYALAQKTVRLRAAEGERDAAHEALRATEHELGRAARALDALRAEHDAALRQLQTEKGLRVEISDMVRADGERGRNMMEGASVYEVQRAMEELAEATGRAAKTARRAAEEAEAEEGRDAGARNSSRDDSSESASSSARATLERDLRACEDALLIMADEDDARAAAARAAGASMGLVATASGGSAPLDDASRAVRRKALEIKADFLSALVDAATLRRETARARREASAHAARADVAQKSVVSLRGDAAASKMLRFAKTAREAKRASEAERRAAEAEATAEEAKAKTARSRWTAGGLRARETVARDERHREEIRGRWDAVTVDARRSARDDRGEDAEDDFESRRAGESADAREETREVEREVEREHSNGIARRASPTPPRFRSSSPSPSPSPRRRARGGVLVARGGGARPAETRRRPYSAIMRERRDRDGFDDGDDRARRDDRGRDGGRDDRGRDDRGRDHGRERGDGVTRAGSGGKKTKKGWSPPPWDSSSLQPSQAKTRNPYAARASKLRR